MLGITQRVPAPTGLPKAMESAVGSRIPEGLNCYVNLWRS